jgi:hypothetical protein
VYGADGQSVNELTMYELIDSYRRDTDDITGAVRKLNVESVTLEQMPGGRFQVSARMASGDGCYVSPSMTTLADGQKMLKDMRIFLSGLGPHPVAVVQGFMA